METMTSKPLVTAIAERSGLTQADSAKALKAFADILAETVALGHAVRVSRIGTFSRVHRPAKDGRNPATGETMRLPESHAVRFKPAASLKAAVQD